MTDLGIITHRVPGTEAASGGANACTWHNVLFGIAPVLLRSQDVYSEAFAIDDSRTAVGCSGARRLPDPAAGDAGRLRGSGVPGTRYGAHPGGRRDDHEAAARRTGRDHGWTAFAEIPHEMALCAPSSSPTGLAESLLPADKEIVPWRIGD